MNIFLSRLILFIIYLLKIHCYFNNDNLNLKTTNDLNIGSINSEDELLEKKLLFESYKYNNNSILFNTPRIDNENYTLGKWNKEKKEYLPFPNDEWNKKNSNCDGSFISVLSFEFDDKDNLYVFDEGNKTCPDKLCKLKMNGNEVEESIIYNINKTFNTKNILFDSFVVDKINNYAYLIYTNDSSTNENKQTLHIILIDLNSKHINSDEVLIKIKFDENYSIPNKINENLNINNYEKKLVSITLSCDGESLFISPFSDRKIYSISTEDLRNNNKNLIINEAYKNDASLSLISSDIGNLYFTGYEKNVIYIAGQIDNDLSGFDYRSLDKIEIKENISFISKISLANGKLYITYINETKTGYFEKKIDEDNTFENSYVYRCTGLIYKYDWKSYFVWVIFFLIVIFIIIFVLDDNKHDLDNNKKEN